MCVFQTMPTDMCALQDFDEPDKLQIQLNDVITIIEGRWVSSVWDFEQEASLQFCDFDLTNLPANVITDRTEKK